jgi:S1-C subfamily serine protease
MLLLSLLLALVGGPQAAAPTCPANAGEPAQAVAGLQVCTTGVPLVLDGGKEVGIVVAAIDAESALAKSGLRAGDVIVRIEGERTRTSKDVAAQLTANKDAREILINFRRNDLPLLVRVGR